MTSARVYIGTRQIPMSCVCLGRYMLSFIPCEYSVYSYIKYAVAGAVIYDDGSVKSIIVYGRPL